MNSPNAASATNPVVTSVIDAITASPSPYHAVATARARLLDAGFVECDLAAALPDGPSRGFAAFDGALVAWVDPSAGVGDGGFRIVGAHTDSPNLRVGSVPDVGAAGVRQVGIEVYGGVLANSWLDRDLGISGRLVLADGSMPLVRIDEPWFRVPQLAIHLDREIRTDGLKLDPASHLTPTFGAGEPEDGALIAAVAGVAGVDPADVRSWDLMFHDLQAPAVVGPAADQLASARIDNQVSCFAALAAIAQVDPAELAGTAVLVLSDHEEVGSSSATGAGGAMLEHLLERLSAAAGVDRVGHLRRLAGSVVVSADGAHATHPNYVSKHRPEHPIRMNGGVVIKRNANQRYATDGRAEGFARRAIEAAGVEVQIYVHRNDLPCGSTIGPITATRLGVPTVDLGVAQLAMHSAREVCGTRDIADLAAVVGAAFTV